MTFAVPLIVVCAAGFIINWFWFIVVGSKSSEEDCSKHNMMVWGHATGVAATGVLLQRVVDPEMMSRGIEDSGVTRYLQPSHHHWPPGHFTPMVITRYGHHGFLDRHRRVLRHRGRQWIAAYVTKGWVPQPSHEEVSLRP